MNSQCDPLFSRPGVIRQDAEGLVLGVTIEGRGFCFRALAAGR